MMMPISPRRPLTGLLIAVLLACMILPVAGCGRKGQPEAPPGADYPRVYPGQ